MFGTNNEQNEMDVIELLEFLSNSTRRSILELLAKEDLYPFQISRLLDISPRLITKYLTELEDLGIITFEKKGSSRGPNRTYASLNNAFSVIIDVGKNTFSVEYLHAGDIIKEQKQELEKKKDLDVLQKEISKEVSEIRDFIKERVIEIGEMDQKRRQKVQEINKAFQQFYYLIKDIVPDYSDREIIQNIFKLVITKPNNLVSLTELAGIMRIWRGQLKERIDALTNIVGCIKVEEDRNGEIWYSI